MFMSMKTFFLMQKNENYPFYLGIPSVIFQVIRLSYSLLSIQKKITKIKYRISHMYKLTLWRLH